MERGEVTNHLSKGNSLVQFALDRLYRDLLKDNFKGDTIVS